MPGPELSVRFLQRKVVECSRVFSCSPQDNSCFCAMYGFHANARIFAGSRNKKPLVGPGMAHVECRLENAVPAPASPKCLQGQASWPKVLKSTGRHQAAFHACEAGGWRGRRHLQVPPASPGRLRTCGRGAGGGICSQELRQKSGRRIDLKRGASFQNFHAATECWGC